MADSESTPSIDRSGEFDLQATSAIFGSRLQLDVPLARFTAARVGGLADGFIEAGSADDLAEIVTQLWEKDAPFFIIGGGSNILVSDNGFRGIVILNKARRIRFDLKNQPPQVWAESGANMGSLARQAATRGLGGLEWAAGIPGTLGGAIVGNAGAHGGEISGDLALADILHRAGKRSTPSNGNRSALKVGREKWSSDQFQFSYRSSVIKEAARQGELNNRIDAISRKLGAQKMVVLAAVLNLETSTREEVNKKMGEYLDYRRTTQPSGASMGSMFKNPPGDFAGRLIEAAGLKGTRVGNAQISPLHANFFINLGGATAKEISQLIRLARGRVADRFGTLLDLEIEYIGDWGIEELG